MTDLVESIRAINTRNLTRGILERKFASAYREMCVRIERGEAEDFLGIWRAVFRYEAMTVGPEDAIVRIRNSAARIGPRDRFVIFQDYFNQTNRLEELEQMYLESIAAGTYLTLAVSGCLRLYCRTGDLVRAHETLREAIVQGSLPLAELLRFSHMLGRWEDIAALLGRSETAGKLNPLARWKYEKVLEWSRDGTDPTFPYPHVFINLERAEGRREGLLTRYRQIGTEPEFHVAFDGSTMSEEVYREWCPKEVLHHGGVANGRSQCAVWQKFLASDASHMAISEDDAWPYADLGTVRDLVDEIETHAPDILFFNERGAGQWWDRLPVRSSSYFEAISSFTDAMRAPGLDGYLLSRQGAEKLVEAFAEDRIVYNVDWQIASYGLTDNEIETMPEGVQQTVFRSIRKRTKSAVRMSSRVLNRPIVCQFAAGLATVHETNRLIARRAAGDG